MKTRKFFAFTFWIGIVLILSNLGLQLSSAVWHEEQVTNSQPIDRLDSRLKADESQGQTISSTNSNLGQPGLILLVIGAVGWLTSRIIEESKRATEQRIRLKESAKKAKTAESVKHAKTVGFHNSDLQKRLHEAAAAGKRVSRT